MKAYVRLIFSSDGSSPASVDPILANLGFERVKGTAVFQAGVADEAAGDAKFEELHAALRGMTVRYIPTIGKAPAAVQAQAGGYQEKLAKYKEIGFDTDELSGLLQSDLPRFRERAIQMLSEQLDKIAAEREKELHEVEAKARVEKARERIVEAAREAGGKTFSQLAQAVGIDEDILTQMLDDMVKKGRLAAEQRGRRVVYVAV
jgi:hypothetical protein